VVLTWTGPAGATFTVQRGTDSAFSTPTTLACTTSPCTDSPLAAGTYYYQVGNVTGFGTIWSASIEVGPPAAPSNLTATLSGTTGVRLVWRDNAPSLPTPPNLVGESGFTIVRTNPDTTTTNINAPAQRGTGNMAYTDTPPGPGTYSYQVHAYNIFGSSTPSNQVTITR
jgi:hypothetical protein